MLTAVQLLEGFYLRSELLAGSPLETVRGTLGRIALLPSGCVSVYKVEWRRAVRLIVFRTPPTSGALMSKVAGILPAVQVLLEVAGRRRTTRIARVLRSLNRRGIPLDRLPDAFWARLGAVVVLRESLCLSVTHDLLARTGIATLTARLEDGPRARKRYFRE
jgi:hypothetical protein